MLTRFVRRPPVPNLTSDQWVLSLFAAKPEKPIHGKTLIAAELTGLASREIPQLDSIFGFSRSRNIIDSPVFASALDKLVGVGLIMPREEKETSGPFPIDRTDYSLTPEGQRAASQLFNDFDPRLRNLLQVYRDRFDDVGVWEAIGLISDVSERSVAPASGR